MLNSIASLWTRVSNRPKRRCFKALKLRKSLISKNQLLLVRVELSRPEFQVQVEFLIPKEIVSSKMWLSPSNHWKTKASRLVLSSRSQIDQYQTIRGARRKKMKRDPRQNWRIGLNLRQSHLKRVKAKAISQKRVKKEILNMLHLKSKQRKWLDRAANQRLTGL